MHIHKDKMYIRKYMKHKKTTELKKILQPTFYACSGEFVNQGSSKKNVSQIDS